MRNLRLGGTSGWAAPLTTAMTDSTTAPVPELPGGPYDIEFFFDPGCPFAWQTSVWIRRVIELRGIKGGWRVISLEFVIGDMELPPQWGGRRVGQRVAEHGAARLDRCDGLLNVFALAHGIAA